MGWRRLPEPTRDEKSKLRRMRKLRLYADEDIEERIVELLRDEGVNIESRHDRQAYGMGATLSKRAESS